VKELHYYLCHVCKRMMSRSVRAIDMQRCDNCRSRMDYVYSVPVETPTQESLHARGRVFNPHPERVLAWTCVRCEAELPYVDVLPRYRVDGKCCTECVKAEAPRPLLTPDEQVAHLARKAAARREMEAAMERAIEKADAR
jgi:hypothetical protein